jgi:hypothetical protein
MYLFLLFDLMIILRKFYMILRSVLLGSIFSVILVSCNNKASNKASDQKDEVASDCKNEIRGGFDIGSGSTKLQVASVKVCKNGDITIEKSYFKENANVQYSAAMGNGKILPDDIINSGFDAMSKLKKDALDKLAKDCGSSCTVSSWRGIMTAAFRKAENWETAQKELSKVADGLIIKRLAQDEEALYGYYPVIKIKGVDPKNIVVWDMGGGSTQITAFSKDFKINDDFIASGAKVIETAVGSGTFENVLKDGEDSFNPINDNIQNGINFVNYELDNDLNKEEKKDIKDNFNELFVNGKKYFVIGGILSRAVPTVAKVHLKDYKVFNYDKITNVSVIQPLSKANLDNFFAPVSRLSDDELKTYAVENKIMTQAEADDAKNASRYKSISSNLLLTKTYMESDLKITNIYPIVLDGSDTLMISPKFANENYWKFDKLTGK